MKIQINEHVKMFARDLATGETLEVTNWLYWFEEEGVKSLDGEGFHGKYEFWLEVNSLVNVTSYGDTQTTLLPLPQEEPPIIIMPASEASP